MKDLKYTIYFEKLLEDAHNELVKKAQDDGQICLGYTCYHIPEVILNVDNCFSTRLICGYRNLLHVQLYLPVRQSHRGTRH